VPTPIKKLSDGFADYSLRIVCRRCKHERVVEPHALAKLCGWEAELAVVAARMCCSKCSARDCELKPFTPGYRPR
jgi:hypothetical protein